MKARARWIILGLFLALNAAFIWRMSGDSLSSSARVVEVFPSDIKLQTKRASQALVVRVTDPDGVTHDISASAKITADPKLA